MIPCKPNCLRFPMCIDKTAVRCPVLYYYFKGLTKDKKMTPNDSWDYIRTFLPNVGSISDAAEDL